MLPGHIYRSPRGPVRALWMSGSAFVFAYLFITGEETTIELADLGSEITPLDAALAVQRVRAELAALHIASKPPKRVKKATV